MNNIAGIPYTIAQFNEDGVCIRQPVVPDGATELIVISHGWNNNADEAEQLYRELFTSFADVNPDRPAALAIIGVLWPSKTFDLGDRNDAPAGADAVQAAGVGTAATSRAAVTRALAQFEHVFDTPAGRETAQQLGALLPDLENETAQAEFVQLLRKIVPQPEIPSPLDGSAVFFGACDPGDVFRNAQQASSDTGGQQAPLDEGDGGAAGLGDVFDGIGNAVSSLLNISTYYAMKTRAGVVGAVGLATLLDQLAAPVIVNRLHLVGHSFGARLVTAAALASTTSKLYSMSLLQAAFSHNGFALHGYFRGVVDHHRVPGPILITHTPNDSAVGRAYAIASRLSNDAAKGLGGPEDPFGGLGCNGARNMGNHELAQNVNRLLAVNAPYTLQRGRIHNLEASEFISSHSDVKGKQIAWAIGRAVASP